MMAAAAAAAGAAPGPIPADRDTWEDETVDERAVRRAWNQYLLTIVDEKKKSIYEQAKLHVPHLVVTEETILGLKTITGQTNQAKKESLLAINRQKRWEINERIKGLKCANKHGWEVATEFISQRDPDDDKEVKEAIAAVKKRKAAKTTEHQPTKAPRGRGRGRGY